MSIPAPITIVGPLNHSNDYETCWKLFCIDREIILESLTRSIRRLANRQENFDTVFIGTNYQFSIMSNKAVSSDEQSTVTSLSVPSSSSSKPSFELPLSTFPCILVHGVSSTWKPSNDAAHWHALDLFANNPSNRSITNFVFNISRSSIGEFIIWGIDGIKNNNLLQNFFTEWSRQSPSNVKLLFVVESLLSLDNQFIDMFDTRAIVAVAPEEMTNTTVRNFEIEYPEIDVSRISKYALELAKTNFVIPMTEPDLIQPFSSLISMAPRVLIHGRSKSGKSSLAKWMIRSVMKKRFPAMNIIEMHASQLFSKYLGGSEKRIQKLFRRAAASAPCIVLVEGIHSICPSRNRGGEIDEEEEEAGGVGQTYTRVLATFLMCLDGIDSVGAQLDRVAFIGTSLLDPSKLDPAAVRPGRLEVHIGLDGF